METINVVFRVNMLWTDHIKEHGYDHFDMEGLIHSVLEEHGYPVQTVTQTACDEDDDA